MLSILRVDQSPPPSTASHSTHQPPPLPPPPPTTTACTPCHVPQFAATGYNTVELDHPSHIAFWIWQILLTFSKGGKCTILRLSCFKRPIFSWRNPINDEMLARLLEQHTNSRIDTNQDLHAVSEGLNSESLQGFMRKRQQPANMRGRG